MRTYFRNTKRAKLVAESLTVVFPGLKHTEALEWAAKIFGYRNWHELDASANGAVTPTPFPADELEPNESVLRGADDIAEFQEQKLQELMGRDFPDAHIVARWTIHAENHNILRSPKRLLRVPEGLRPMHASLAHDRFFFGATGAQPTDDLGQMDYGDECYACFQVLPDDLLSLGLQADFIERTKERQGLQKAQEATRILEQSRFSPTVATFENDDQGLAAQMKDMTLFLYDEDAKKLRGVGNFQFGIEVGYSKGARVSFLSRGVVLDPGFEFLHLQMATVVAEQINQVVTRLTWAQVGGPSEEITVAALQLHEASDEKEVMDIALELVTDELKQRESERYEVNG